MKDFNDTSPEKPLIIYVDDNGEIKRTYSNYEITESTISFTTTQNKITIPISRLVKIKEPRGLE